jgi:retinoblastoma-associated protein
MLSPYAQQYVVATPMTSAMEMYNWVHDKLSAFKKVAYYLTKLPQ